MIARNCVGWLCIGWVLLGVFQAAADTVVIDDRSPQFATTGVWSSGTSAGYHVTGYQYALTTLGESATATWTLTFPSAGTYEVAVWYVQGSNRPTDARFVVNHSGGSTVVLVDQTTQGSQWRSIGTFDFPVSGGSVVLSNQSSVAGKAAMADAVRFVRVGTTYGDLYQAMWVYAWGLGIRSETETSDMIAVARANNLNAVFVQVRKVADSYYVSATEPRGSNIDPAYADPLADVIAKAHDTSGGKQYIEVHAWVVPYRVWTDSLGTPPAGHVLNEHPDWRGQTDTGATSDGSQYLDPGVPAVTDYLVDVVSEIVSNYAVDGIHWDYFRYPGTQWGYNPTAIARFNALYGKSGSPAQGDPDFCDFRRDQIRYMGRKVYPAVKAIRWNVKMSSATIQWGAFSGDFTQSSAYSSIFQDWPRFMNEGVLDLNVLMNYKREYNTAQAHDYRDWAQYLAATKAGRHAINGPGVYMNHIYDSVTQTLYGMDLSGIDGTNFYVYHQTNMDGDSATDFWDTMRADCFTQRRNVPAASWLSTPTQGILRGTVTVNGQPGDGMSLTLSNGASGSSTTDGTGFCAFLKADAGSNYSVTASVPGFPNQTKSFAITAGQLTTVDFVFPETTPTATAPPSPTPTEVPTPSPTAPPSPTATPAPSPTGTGISDWDAFIVR